MMPTPSATVETSTECCNDYVLVEESDDDSDDESYCLVENESYDYCFDVTSVGSSLSDQEDPSSLPEQLTRTSCTTTEIPRSIDVSLLVPSILMENLDDAHAAASLVQIPDLEKIEDSTDDSSKGEEDLDERSTTNEDPTGMMDCRPMMSSKCKKGMGMIISRSSNKKRRKKLKRDKKAQAAAHAARILEERNRKFDSESSRSRRNQKRGLERKSTKSTRKHQNAAVACAVETLTEYRQQLLLNNEQDLG